VATAQILDLILSPLAHELLAGPNAGPILELRPWFKLRKKESSMRNLCKSRWLTSFIRPLARRDRKPESVRGRRLAVLEQLEARTMLAGGFTDAPISDDAEASLLFGLSGFADFGSDLSSTGRFADPLALLSLQDGGSFSLGTVLNVGDELRQRLLLPMQDFFGMEAGGEPTVFDLVDFLTTQPNIVDVTGGLANSPANELRFEVTIEEAITVSNLGINFGPQGEALGLSTRNTTVNGGTVEFDATFAFGLNLDPDLNTEQAFFVRDVSLGVTLSILDPQTVNVSVGFLEVPNTSVTFNYVAELNVTLNDVVPGDFGSVTLSELNGYPTEEVANVTVGVNQAGPTTFLLRPDVGGWSPGVAASITVSGPAIGSELQITHVENKTFQELQNFRNVDAEQLLAGVSLFGAWLDGFVDSSVLDVSVPFLKDVTLGNSFDSGDYFESNFQRDLNGVPIFDSVQEYAALREVVYNPRTHRLVLTQDVVLQTIFDNLELTLENARGAGLGFPLSGLELDSLVAPRSEFTLEFEFGIDLSDPKPVPPGTESEPPTAEELREFAELQIEHLRLQFSAEALVVNGSVSLDATNLSGTARYGVVGISFDHASLLGQSCFEARIRKPDDGLRATLGELIDGLNEPETLLAGPLNLECPMQSSTELILNDIEIEGENDAEPGLFELIMGQFGLLGVPSLTASVTDLANFAENGEITLNDSPENIGRLAYFRNLTNESIVGANTEALRSLAGFGLTGIDALDAVGMQLSDFVPTDQFNVIADTVRAALEAFEATNGPARLQDWDRIFAKPEVLARVRDIVAGIGFDVESIGLDVTVTDDLSVPDDIPAVEMDFTIEIKQDARPVDLGLNLGALAGGTADPDDRTALVGLGAFSRALKEITAEVWLTLHAGLRIKLADPQQTEFALYDPPQACLLTATNRTSLSAGVHIMAGEPLDAEFSIGVLGVKLEGGSFVVSQMGDESQPATFQIHFKQTDENNVPIDDCVPLAAPVMLPSLETTVDGQLAFDFQVTVEPGPLEGRFNFEIPDLSVNQINFPDPGNGVLNFPDLVAGIGTINLPDNLFALPGGLHDLFGGIGSAFDLNIFGRALPFVGGALGGVTNFIEDLQLKFDDALDGLQDFACQAIADGLEGSLGGGVTIEQRQCTPDRVEYRLTKTEMGMTQDPIQIHSDVGLPWLGFNIDATVEVVADYTVGLTFGVSKDDGVYIRTDDEELSTSLRVNLSPGADGKVFEGMLGFINVNVETATADNGCLLGAATAGELVPPNVLELTFNINLADPGTDPNSDGLLTVREIGRAAGDPASLIDFGDTGVTGRVDLELKATVDTDIRFLPGISTCLDFHWFFDPGTNIGSPNAGRKLGDISPEVNYRNVCVDVGQFFSQTLLPILRPIAVMTGGIHDVLQVLRSPLPIISDLLDDEGPVTLLSLAAALSPSNPLPDTLDKLGAVLDAISPVIDLAGQIRPGDLLGQICLDDDISFSSDQTRLFDFDIPLVDQGIELLDYLPPNFDELTIDLFDEFSNLTIDPSLGDLRTNLKGAFDDIRIDPDLGVERAKLSFPFLEDPLSVFKFLFGFGEATLVELKLPTVGGSLPFRILVPIFPLISAGISGSIEVSAAVSVGFDTFGFREYQKSCEVMCDLRSLAAGLFISDTADPGGTGPDVPEFMIRGELNAALELGGAVASAGVEGGIFAEINANLHDPNHDGKIRGSEMISGTKALDLRGTVGIELAAYVQALGGAFRKEFPFARKDLGSFHTSLKWPDLFGDGNPAEGEPETRLAVLENGVLTLLVGDRASERSENANPFETDERFTMFEYQGVLVVSAFGVGQSFDPADVTGIVADFGGGNDALLMDGNHALVNGQTIELGTVRQPATVAGGEGADLIVTGRGGDCVFGGPGDDIIRTGEGRDTVFGGDGNDAIGGGDENGLGDNLTGGEGDDQIDAGAGDDTASGDSGDDVITGRDGADVLTGDDGSDTICGGGFTENSGELSETACIGDGDLGDTIDGGLGSDQLYGGPGDDDIVGDEGSDFIFGDAGADELSGGIDQDVIHGGDDNDTIRGGDGLDVLVGEDGDDSIFGGKQDDTIEGGFGDDTVMGEGGNDVLFGDVNFVPEQFVPRSALPAAPGPDSIDGGEGFDYIEGGAENDTLHGGADDDTIFGGGGDDRIHGDEANDLLFGDDGDDRVHGDDGEDAIDGGAANDKLFGGDDDDTIRGQGGDDEISGEEGADMLFGDNDADRIYGESEDTAGMCGLLLNLRDADTIYGGSHRDEIFGGCAGDLIFGEGANDIVHGDEGPDSIDGGDDDDDLFGDAGADYVQGGRDDDEIDGGTENDTLRGGPGDDDTIVGGEGRDMIFGDGGNDVIEGGTQADEIDGGDGDDDLTGNGDDDEIYGNVGNDAIEGNDGQDVLRGNKGDDAIEGNGGSDDVIGGEGRDTVGGGDQNDTIQGGPDEDLIYGDVGEDELSGGGANDTIRGGEDNDTAHGDAGDDLVIGNGGDDMLFGDDGHDVLYGNLGNDTLTGGTENDRAYGDFGDDSIDGEDGDDVLEGGPGNDTASGGAGRAALYGDEGVDNLSGGDDDDFIMAGNGVGDVLNGDGGDDHIVGSDDSRDSNTTSIFGDVIAGGPGNDTIESLGGADVITVGLGTGQPITQGLLGYWPFDDSGADRSGRMPPRDLTFSGGASIATGLFDDALNLNGIRTRFASRPVSDADFDLTGTSYTIQTWVNFRDAAGEQVLIEKFQSNLPPGWTLTKLDPNDDLDVNTNGDMNIIRFHADVILNTPPVNIAPGWHHVVVVRDGGTISIHYDGVEVATMTNVASAITPSTQPLLLGRRNAVDFRGFPLDGMLDDVAIWNRALSDSEIALLCDPDAGTCRGRSITAAASVSDIDSVTDDVLANGTRLDQLIGGTPLPGPMPTLNLSTGPVIGGHWAELAGSATDGGITEVGGFEQATFATERGVYVAWVDWRNGNSEIYLAYYVKESGTWQEVFGSASGGGISHDAQQSRRPSIVEIEIKDVSGNLVATELLVAWTVIDEFGKSSIGVARRGTVNNPWERITNPVQTDTADHARLVRYSDESALLGWLDSQSGRTHVLVTQYVFEPGCFTEFLSGAADVTDQIRPTANVSEFDLAASETRAAVAASYGVPGDHDVDVAVAQSGGVLTRNCRIDPTKQFNVQPQNGPWQLAGTFTEGDAIEPTVGLRHREPPDDSQNRADIYAAWHEITDRMDEVVGVASFWGTSGAPGPFERLIPQYFNQPERSDAQSVSDTIGYAAKPDIATSETHVFLAWLDDGVHTREAGLQSDPTGDGDASSSIHVMSALDASRSLVERLPADASNGGVSPTGGSVDSISIVTEADGADSGAPYVVWTDHRANDSGAAQAPRTTPPAPGAPQVLLRHDIDVPQFFVLITPTGGSNKVTEGGATDTFSVVLVSQPQDNVRINLQPNSQLRVLLGNGDGTFLDFTPTNWFMPQIVTVAAIDDSRSEGSHSGMITPSVTSLGDSDYDGVQVDQIVVQVRDNDFGVTDFTPNFRVAGRKRTISSIDVTAVGLIDTSVITLQNLRFNEVTTRGTRRTIPLR